MAGKLIDLISFIWTCILLHIRHQPNFEKMRSFLNFSLVLSS
jgi:hypothetical protein